MKPGHVMAALAALVLTGNAPPPTPDPTARDLASLGTDTYSYGSSSASTGTRPGATPPRTPAPAAVQRRQRGDAPRIVYNRARDPGYAIWSAGWTGGTYRLRLVDGPWVFEDMGSWIT